MPTLGIEATPVNRRRITDFPDFTDFRRVELNRANQAEKK